MSHVVNPIQSRLSPSLPHFLCSHLIPSANCARTSREGGTSKLIKFFSNIPENLVNSALCPIGHELCRIPHISLVKSNAAALPVLAHYTISKLCQSIAGRWDIKNLVAFLLKYSKEPLPTALFASTKWVMSQFCTVKDPLPKSALLRSFASPCFSFPFPVI